MTQEEILQYNKMCAEFLNLHRNEEVAIYKLNAYPYEYLRFHSDWNWIMEVVEAIKEKTEFKSVDECSEMEWYTTISLTRLTITTPKEAVVHAINQFLLWYNQNK